MILYILINQLSNSDNALLGIYLKSLFYIFCWIKEFKFFDLTSFESVSESNYKTFSKHLVLTYGQYFESSNSIAIPFKSFFFAFLINIGKFGEFPMLKYKSVRTYF